MSPSFTELATVTGSVSISQMVAPASRAATPATVPLRLRLMRARPIFVTSGLYRL